MLTTAPALPYAGPSDTPDVPYWLQQLAEAASGELRDRLDMTSTGAGIDGQTRPADKPWLVKIAKSATGTTSASGVLVVTFPTPFPNGLQAVVAMTASGSAVACALNGAATHDKTKFEVVLNGVNSVAGISVLYVAVGW